MWRNEINTNQLSAPLVIPIAIYASSASSAPILEEMNLFTMLEPTISVFTTLGDYSSLNPDGITNGATSGLV
jgi:hypothetical protein